MPNDNSNRYGTGSVLLLQSAARIQSAENQIGQHNFFDSGPDVIHPPDPLHLVLSLELFRHALAFGVLLHKQIEHPIGGTFDLLQVGIQLHAEKQSGIYNGSRDCSLPPSVC